MKKLVLTGAILGVFASPAFAESLRSLKSVPDSFAQAPAPTARQAARPVTGDAVIVDGKVIGRASEPSIRSALINDYYANRDSGGGSGGDSGSGSAGGDE